MLVYLAAIGTGLAVGLAAPPGLHALAVVVWPLLALLLYTVFTQVPLTGLREALTDWRFLQVAVIGNFLVIPVLVFGLMHLLPDDPAIRIGVVLVLLVPCTDWFITFTHLGGGDTKRALAFSPVSLLMQFLLLPFYLWLFLGDSFVVAIARREMLLAFAGLIVLPLLAAFVTEKLADRSRPWQDWTQTLGWLPVPLLAMVVFVISATQVQPILGSAPLLLHLLLVYTGFLLAAAILAKCLARFWTLPIEQGRVLAFSLGTRNSFVVLPLALALPATHELAVVAIVFQSLVELLGMAVFLWWVPRKLFPTPHY